MFLKDEKVYNVMIPQYLQDLAIFKVKRKFNNSDEPPKYKQKLDFGGKLTKVMPNNLVKRLQK